MLQRTCCALVVGLLVASTASAQVVRFETTVGEFDMVLNPTNNPLLQEHVDNMLQYVEKESYRGSWINRAATGFVLQMGGFFSHTKRPPITIASTHPVYSFDPVQGEPASTIGGLSNTVGTVALALPGDGMGGTNQDAGTSSFFINLTSNTFLDADFTVFAAIPDMTVVNQIMDLMTIDRTTDPDFGAGAGNLGFSDVPIEENGFQVFIERAYQITDTLEMARAMAGVQSTVADSVAQFNGGASSAPLAASVTAVPEPATVTLAAWGLIGFGWFARRRRV